jgi:outer membrane receptor protein involved in Fe transport
MALSKVISRWHINSDWENITTDNARPNSGVKRDCLVLRTLFVPKRGNWELSGSYRYFSDSLGLPGAVPNTEFSPLYGDDEATSLLDHQKDRNHSFDARLKINPDIRSGISGEINMFYEKKKLDYFGRYAYVSINDSVDVIDQNAIDGRNSGLTGRIRWQREKFDLFGGLEYLSGASDYLSVSTTSYTYGDPPETNINTTRSQRNHHRDIYALWGGGNYRFLPQTELGFSQRTELVNGNDFYHAFNVDAKFHPKDNLNFKFAYGKAYRLPSFNDLYWPADYFSAGNPDLIPEKGDNFLFGGAIKTGHEFSAGVDLFYRKVTNLIAWNPQGVDGRWMPTNLNHFRSAGFDLVFTAALYKMIQFDGNLTYQYARQKNEELTISGLDYLVFEEQERKAALVPEIKWRMAISGASKKIDYNIELIYTSSKVAYYGSYFTMENGSSLVNYITKRIASSYVCNAHLEMAISTDITFGLCINDIFDAKPSRQFGTLTDSDYPSAGREIKTSIKLDII